MPNSPSPLRAEVARRIDEWEPLRCSTCDGHGIVSDEKDCEDCYGSGAYDEEVRLLRALDALAEAAETAKAALDLAGDELDTCAGESKWVRTHVDKLDAALAAAARELGIDRDDAKGEVK